MIAGKLTWSVASKILKVALPVALAVTYTWGVWQHGKAAGVSETHEAQVELIAETFDKTVANAAAAITAAADTAVENLQRKEFFDSADSQVDQFYSNRPTTQESPNAADPCNCACPADFFDADELRLFNLGNDPGAAGYP